MGQVKHYRYNIKQQIHSLKFKNKFFYLKNLGISRYGLCLAEAELLAGIADSYFQNELLDIPENYFSISLYKYLGSNKKQNLNNLPRIFVTIPAFSHHELEIYQNQGLQALQTYRIVNMLDSMAYQNAMIDINLLAKVVNIAPKSIRTRLASLLKSGVKIPLTYISGKWSSTNTLFRYTHALKNFFLLDINEDQILKTLFISKSEWNFLLFEFFQFSYGLCSFSGFPSALSQEFFSVKKDICKTQKYHELTKLYSPVGTDVNASLNKRDIFFNTLKRYFSFSNALIIDYIDLLENEAFKSNKTRRHGEVVFYAVSDSTISGTPLAETELKPVTLSFWSSDDNEPQSPYHTTLRKWNKAVRYSLQAQNQSANLTQYDLSYLLGVSVAVVKNLMKKHKQIHIPTRGNAHDIGPGVCHAEQIIKLYLEGYTETEIKFKTNHTYNSIENYLINFTKLVGLTDLGLNLHQIRMTTKMTYNLAAKFKKIYQEFDTDQFAWILAKIRNNFHGKIKKNLRIKWGLL